MRIASPTAKPEVKRLEIKGRQEGKLTEVIYQVVWPAAAAGPAVIIQTEPGRPVQGFLIETPDKSVPLNKRMLERPLFGSDLRIEDLTEDFLHWPSQEVSGNESVLGCLCTIIESRPQSGDSASYSSVRSWICPRLALPLRVERVARDGGLARTLVVEKVAAAGRNKWAARSLRVIPSEGTSRTLLEGTAMELDVRVPAQEFQIEAIRSVFKQPKGKLSSSKSPNWNGRVPGVSVGPTAPKTRAK